MVALDLETGKIAWDDKLPTPAYGDATFSNGVVYTTIFGGEVTGFIGAAQHLTDRKQAEEALREANATLRSAARLGSPPLVRASPSTSSDVLGPTASP